MAPVSPRIRNEFEFDNGLKADAVNRDTREILELKTSAAQVDAGRQRLANYIKATQKQFGGTWTGKVIGQSGEEW